MVAGKLKKIGKKRSVRRVAVQVIDGLLNDKGSLATLLPRGLEQVDAGEQRLLQEFSFGVARWSHRLSALVDQLVSKPIRRKDSDVHVLLQLGLYQLIYMRVPEHAALNTTVAVAQEIGKPWAKGLVNAVLRRYLRERESLDAQLADTAGEAAAVSLPEWMLYMLQQDWPEQWEKITAVANERAPMVLRTNLTRQSRDAYCQKLKDAGISAIISPFSNSAVKLDAPQLVDTLPGFADGCVSVQDTSAQLAVQLLDPQADELILDACAAPGGKTGHLVEHASTVRVLALDNDEDRLVRVRENCHRLKISAQVDVACGDAAQPATWWDGVLFDAILLDAPCSGSGVLRRHPDIKLTRRASDISELANIQQEILVGLWALLKPGGRLLYATCSVFKRENEQQIDAFVSAYNDARIVSLADRPWGIDRGVGRQILLDETGMDGFFYALLQKTHDAH